MTYTDFLKSHFGEDGSLETILKATGFLYAPNGKYLYKKCGNSVGSWDKNKQVWGQSENTQIEIAEHFGWSRRENEHLYKKI